MSLKPLAVLLLIALAAIAQPVLAQTYSMSYGLESGAWLGAVDLSWSEQVNNQTVNYGVNGVAMGPQIITFNGTPPAGLSTSNVAYCVDLYHWDLTPASVYVDPVSSISNISDDNSAVDGLTQAQYNQDLGEAAWLYQTYNPLVQSASGAAESEDGAALQWAIWDVIAGPTFTVTNANSGQASEFTVAQSLANEWYNSSVGQTGNGTLFQIDRNIPAQSDAGQDLLGPAMTPEAPSMILLGFALIGPLLLLARSRMRRRTSPLA